MGECLVIRNGSGIDTSNANATKDTILSGYSCYVNDEKINGSIPTCSVEQTKLNPQGSVTIIQGYYKQTIISTSTLEEETVSSAVSSDLLQNYEGWSNGNVIIGSMPHHNTYNHQLIPNTSYTIPLGWIAAGSTIKQTLAVQGSVSVTPSTANKLACSSNRWTSGSVTVVGDKNLATGNIKSGVTIFGVKGTFTGWVDPVQGNWDPCTNYWNYDYGHGDSGGRFWYWYTNANAFWKGWNYIYMTMSTSVTYSNRIWTSNAQIYGLNSPPIDVYIDFPTPDAVLLIRGFPSEMWNDNSPYTVKIAISSIRTELDRCFPTGKIPFFAAGPFGNPYYFNICDSRKIWFSLT